MCLVRHYCIQTHSMSSSCHVASEHINMFWGLNSMDELVGAIASSEIQVVLVYWSFGGFCVDQRS